MHGHAESPAEDSSGGGSGDGGPPTPPTASPALHRDIKAANIGLTRVKGALYAKVLDWGLARALKGGPAGAGGKSITGGVVGTLGYMAPELAQGLYAPRSDIYALGCVLLELLSGMRVGPTTAAVLEEAAIEDGGGAAAVRAVAEACWPAPAAAAQLVASLAMFLRAPQAASTGPASAA
jgi:hypothetical protein